MLALNALADRPQLWVVFLGALFSGWLGRYRRPGYAVVGSVLLWGAAMAGFGLSRTLPLVLLFLGQRRPVPRSRSVRKRVKATVTSHEWRWPRTVRRSSGTRSARVRSAPRVLGR